jgi:hypothetical protein
VAFDGRDFVVAWHSGGTGIDPEYRLLTQRITRGGTASSDRVWVTGPYGSILTSSLGCARESCLIVWTQRSDPDGVTWQLHGRRFRTGGEPVDDSSFSVNFAETPQDEPHVAWDGSRFVVTWIAYDKYSEGYVVMARTVPTAGPVDPPSPAGPDRLADSAPSVATACNEAGRCLLLNAAGVDDSVLGRTSRLFKRLFGEARLRGARR